MNSRIKIFICFLLFSGFSNISGPVFAQNPLKRFEFERANRKSVTIPFKFINNLIVIPVIINESDTLNFILDTGITTTMITDLTGIDSLVLNFSREIELKGLGMGEPVKGLHSYGNEIKFKGISGINQDIYVITDDLFQLSARMGIPINGILGYSVFYNFIVSVNYDSRLITFYNPDHFSYKKRHSNYTSLPLLLEDTKPYISLSIIDDAGNEHQVKLLIDTGASHSVWLDRNSIPALKIPPGSRNTYLGTGLSGEVHGILARLKALDLAGIRINDVIVSFPDSLSISSAAGLDDRNGSIGSEILKRFNLIIDYPNQLISIKPNSNFKNEFLQNLSGMEVIAPYNKMRIYVVEAVREDSPAEKSGIMKGDVIESINGIKTEKIELSDIYLILQHQPGRKISISFYRDGILMNTTFVLEKFI